MTKNHLALIGLSSLLTACTAGWHAQKVQGENYGPADRLSVGTVQRSIHNGMSSADVIAALGSPNVVSTDDQHREVWVYDKIATDVSYSNSSAFGTILILGASGNAGAASTNQRTLTIAVKFDENHKVRDFSYHQTSF
jgi:outer membrane protein assembly factor BamE (lipoprotein component of BamABCDE complex)